MRDFTFEKYEKLCLVLLKSGYLPLTVSSYLNTEKKIDKIVILRHDVDRKPLNALKMAELENKLGIQAAYYFRYPCTFVPDIIKKVSSLGHEVGYHYEILSKEKGDYGKAIELFEAELNEFREIYDVKTICMHGSPLSKFDNRDLWKCYDFKDFGLIGEAYISIKDVSYFSDTGRSWNWKNKLRDFIKGNNSENLTNINITDDLIKLIQSKSQKKIYILVHPERWAKDSTEWIFETIKDNVFNFCKKVLKMRKK